MLTGSTTELPSLLNEAREDRKWICFPVPTFPQYDVKATVAKERQDEIGIYWCRTGVWPALESIGMGDRQRTGMDRAGKV